MKIEMMMRGLSSLKKACPQWSPTQIDHELGYIFLEVLQDFTDEQIERAFTFAAANLTQWPAPTTIKRFCQGTIKTDEEIGQEVAALIEGAVSSCGYSNPKLAESRVGQIGWEVVRLCGGWIEVCNVEYDTMMSSRKQWRDLATQVAKNFHAVGDNLPPSLPIGHERSDVLSGALKLIKSIQPIEN